MQINIFNSKKYLSNNNEVIYGQYGALAPA
jgi:hypothetical protein